MASTVLGHRGWAGKTRKRVSDSPAITLASRGKLSNLQAWQEGKPSDSLARFFVLLTENKGKFPLFTCPGSATPGYALHFPSFAYRLFIHGANGSPTKKGTVFSTGNGKRKERGKDEGREEKLGQSSCPQADCSQVQGTAGTRLQVTEVECCWSLALDTRGDCKTFHLDFKSWADGKSVV